MFPLLGHLLPFFEKKWAVIYNVDQVWVGMSQCLVLGLVDRPAMFS